jgi:protein CpxP
MNKNKLLIFLIAGLLISNILLVIFMIKGRGTGHHGPPPRHGGPRDLIIERLHFDEAQVQQFEKLIQEHQKNLRTEDEALMTIKNTLYINLKSEENKTVTDSLINSMVTIQNKIEHVHYSHFQDIKKICKPEQLEDFNELASELSRLFGPPKGPPPHHKPH